MAYSEADQLLRDDAIAAYQSYAPDALRQLQKARLSLPMDGGLIICEAGALLAAGDPAALDQLITVLDQAPDWIDGHRALAQYQFENKSNYLAQLEKALKAMPNKGVLWRLYMQLLVDGGDSKRAADTAKMLRKRGAPADDFMVLEARYAGLAEQHDRAETLFARLPAGWAGKALDEARHSLRQADGDRAEKLLAVARQAEPDNVVVWALTEICWRLISDKRHAWLLPETLRPEQVDLEFDQSFLDGLAETLRNFHSSQSRPLGQSVRDGTQTRGNLFLRDDKLLDILSQRFVSAVQDYQSKWPERDSDHPIMRYRDKDLALTAGWSIRIGPSGHHVSHVHDQGLVSSAFHIVVPRAGAFDPPQGDLELGRPPSDIALGLQPLARFRPKIGHLVLFPSFLYHGTTPIAEGERLTVAFDAAVTG